MLYLLPLALAHDIEPADFASVASIRGLSVSPDGRTAAYLEQRWDVERDGRVADIWRVPVRGGPPERLTFSASGGWSLTWSADSQHLYFLRGGQVHRMPAEGGVAVAITAAPEGVRSYSLTADGATLWYTTSAEQPHEDGFSALRGEHGGVQYGHDAAQTTALHRLDLGSFRDEEVLAGERTIYELAVSPDGSKVAMLTAPNQPLIWREGHSTVDILFTADGTQLTLPDTQWRAEAPSPFGWLGGLAWRPDSGALAFDIGFDGYAAQLYVARFGDGGLRETERIAIGDPRTFVGGTRWWDGALCFTASEQARLRLVCQDGGRERVITPQEDAVVWDWAPAGRSAVVLLAPSDGLADLHVVRGQRTTPLTHVNPQADDWRMPQARRVSWPAPDGALVEGVLWLPPGWTEADGPLPTLIELHGGPTWSTHVSFPGVQTAVFPAKGWAVLSPNYRGSIGYGDAFLAQLVGRENDIEVADILAGVDHLIAEGIADGDKLAVRGWSNGGYLTNCLIATTDRFKAASSGAGVFDQTLQWAIEDTPGHVINYMEGLPWEQPEAVQAASPLFAADQIKTPTLIHVGEDDPRVPAAHSRALFRALSFYLDVPSELMVYPGEGHGLSKLSHREAKSAWDIAWFERYVLGEEGDVQNR